MLKGDTGKSNIDYFAIDRLAGKTESVTMSGVAVPVKNSPCFFKSIIFKPVTGLFYKIGRGLSPCVLSLNFVGFFGKWYYFQLSFLSRRFVRRRCIFLFHIATGFWPYFYFLPHLIFKGYPSQHGKIFRFGHRAFTDDEHIPSKRAGFSTHG